MTQTSSNLQMIMNLRRFYCRLLQTVQLPYFQLFPFFQIPGLKPALKKEKKKLVIFLFFNSTASCIYELSPDLT